MYKHEGSYYLMAAEGGTGVNHSVVIAIGVLVGWVGSAVNGSHRMSIEKLESWKCQGDQWGTMGNNGEQWGTWNLYHPRTCLSFFWGGFCWGDVQSTCMAWVFSMSGSDV